MSLILKFKPTTVHMGKARPMGSQAFVQLVAAQC